MSGCMHAIRTFRSFWHSSHRHGQGKGLGMKVDFRANSGCIRSTAHASFSPRQVFTEQKR